MRIQRPENFPSLRDIVLVKRSVNKYILACLMLSRPEVVEGHFDGFESVHTQKHKIYFFFIVSSQNVDTTQQ